jgi:hypothetical protein
MGESHAPRVRWFLETYRMLLESRILSTERGMDA